MGDVKKFTGVTRLDIDPDQVLGDAIGEMTEVVIVGFDKDGNEFFSSSVPDAGNAFYHLQRAIWAINQKVDEMSCP